MEDRDKTKAQLLAELAALRRRVTELEATEARRRQVEEALRVSEERFRKAFDTELVAMAISRRQDGIYLEANPGFCKMTGYAYDEIIGHTSRELKFFSAPQRQTLLAALEEHGRLTNQELTFPTKSGAPRTILFSIGPLTIGNEPCLLATMVDITDRRQMEDALRKSEERYRFIYNNSPAMLHSIDRKGRLVSVSDYWLETLGYERHEVIGRSSTDFLTEESRRYAVEVALPQYFQTGLARDVPFQLVKKNGEVIEVLLSAISERDEAGEIIRSLAVLVDITARKRSEEAYRALVEYSLQGLCIMQAGRVVFANTALAEMFGYTVAELLAMSPQEAQASLLPEGQAFIRHQAQTRQMGEPVSDRYEIQVYTKHRELRWTEQFVAAITYQGQPALQIAVVDITERKRMEAALRTSEANLKALINNTEDIIVARDRDLRVTIYNDAFAQLVSRLFGVEATVGLRTVDYLPEEARRHWEAVTDRVLGGKRYRELFEYDLDGERRYNDLAFNPITTQGGEIVGIAEFSHDVTAHRRAQEALRQATQRLQTLHEVDRAILEAKSMEAIARVALQGIKPLLTCHSCSVLAYDADTQEFRVLDTEASDGAARSLGAQLSAQSKLVEILTRGEIVLLESIQPPHLSSADQRLAAAAAVQAVLLVPLVAQQEFIGVLAAAAEHADRFTPNHEEVLSELATSLAVALQQARLLDQTRRDAETKALLLHEVNHRVLNNLTMILSILDIEQRRPLTDKADFQAALQDVASRIKGMTTLHRMLSRAARTPLELSEVLAEVSRAALSGSPIQDSVEVIVDGPDGPLPLTSEQAMAVALMINELTTNSVKYAFYNRSRGRIDIRIVTPARKDKGETVELLFRDDGPGLPAEVLAGTQRNVGLWLVEANATLTLGGKVAFWNDNGAVVSFTFERSPLV